MSYTNFQNNITRANDTTLNQMQIELMKLVFPIGSTYITQTNTNPSTILNFGTWERFNGKICIGLDSTDTTMNSIGKTGGEKTHTLKVNEIPSHNHSQRLEWSTTTGWGLTSTGDSSNALVDAGNTTGNTGGGEAHNNMPPFEVVGYMWIRRA